MAKTVTVGTRRALMVTDLDEPEITACTSTQLPNRKIHKKRPTEKKILHTISGSFGRRTRSAECNVDARKEDKVAKHTRVNSYFNELLQEKDRQMEKLLQRLGTLHKFNEQFADENSKLRDDVGALEARIEQLHTQIRDCIKCQKLGQRLSQAVERSKQCEGDVEMMKTLVYRLNVQIERYQDQLRLRDEPAHSESDPPGSGRAVPLWEAAVHTHTLAPLLNAYDEMISEKEQLIQQYRQDFDHFTGELKRVVEENNRLLRQTETIKKDVGNWREERTRLQAQLDVCRTKAEAQARKSDLAKEKLVEVMNCYEQKTQSLMLDMDHLQSAYTRCKAELTALKSLGHQPKNVAQSLQECKDLLEELKQQHRKEKQSLQSTVEELTERSQGLQQRIEKLNSENVALKQELDTKKSDIAELSRRSSSLQRANEKVTGSRDRLKARLRIALQWAQKLEEGQANIQSTWDALKRLEAIVKNKEAQVRGLHARHVQELDRMQKKLVQKEETIRTILKGRLETGHAAAK